MLLVPELLPQAAQGTGVAFTTQGWHRVSLREAEDTSRAELGLLQGEAWQREGRCQCQSPCPGSRPAAPGM